MQWKQEFDFERGKIFIGYPQYDQGPKGQVFEYHEENEIYTGNGPIEFLLILRQCGYSNQQLLKVGWKIMQNLN